RRRYSPPCRLHVESLRRRAAARHADAGEAARRRRIHRSRAGWTEPMVDEAVERMGVARAETRRRDWIRPLHEWSLSARYEVPSLAPRQSAIAVSVVASRGGARHAGENAAITARHRARSRAGNAERCYSPSVGAAAASTEIL